MRLGDAPYDCCISAHASDEVEEQKLLLAGSSRRSLNFKSEKPTAISHEPDEVSAADAKTKPYRMATMLRLPNMVSPDDDVAPLADGPPDVVL